jgi:hypothetical protein
MAVYNPAVREPERGTDGEQSRYGISQAVERPKQKSEHLSPAHPQKRLSHPKEPPMWVGQLTEPHRGDPNADAELGAYFNE